MSRRSPKLDNTVSPGLALPARDVGHRLRHLVVVDAVPGVCMIHMMKSADLIRELIKVGWILDRVRGSHHVFTHPSRPGIVVVPHPRKDLGKGLVAKIRRQAGI
jgi:predicted RNA binding protein YcfA (HicA-like mRNA interferase family)